MATLKMTLKNVPPLSLKSLIGKAQKPLTDKQYLTLRDGGCVEDISNVDNDWYNKVRDTYITNSPKNPILNAQTKLIGVYIDNGILAHDTNLDSMTYSEARKAIRGLAKYTNKDERYLRLISNYEKHAAYKPKGIKNG